MAKGKKHATENFAVFLTHGNELFARCYHLYYNGELRERQRYVFAPDGFARYGIDNNEWRICTRFREPVFHLGGYGYFDNSYTILNADAIYRSCMRYSQFDKYTGGLAFEYLKLYHKHPNLEYICLLYTSGLRFSAFIHIPRKSIHTSGTTTVNGR